MKELVMEDLEIKFNYPENWDAVNNKDVFVDILGMSEAQAVNTDLVLIRNGNNQNEIAFVNFHSNEDIYKTEPEYQKALDEIFKNIQETFEEFTPQAPTKTKNNIRLDRVTAKVIPTMQTSVVQNYLYASNRLILIIATITAENDDLDKSINEIIQSITSITNTK